MCTPPSAVAEGMCLLFVDICIINVLQRQYVSKLRFVCSGCLNYTFLAVLRALRVFSEEPGLKDCHIGHKYVDRIDVYFHLIRLITNWCS